jgi:hypothetical protein
MNALTVIFMLGLNAFHPVHVSYTNIDISPENGEVNLVYKFFTDDLKLLFYHIYERQLDFDPERELTASEIDLIKNHLLNSFFLKEHGGKVVDFLYIKKEQNEESVWLYFEGRLSDNHIDSLLVGNTLLLDLFEDQKNLVILKYGGRERGYSFDYVTREVRIEFSDK